MPTLSEYVNVYDTALSVLASKGFQVWRDPKTNRYYAERNGWDFGALSPCALLGLVAIFEYVHPDGFEEYWWRVSQDAFRTIPELPAPYESVMKTKTT